MVKLDQISVFASSSMERTEEVRRSLQRSLPLPLTSEVTNMETILIVLLVLFLLGGGGYGYSRWNR
jgi:hypothetical protein